MSGEGLLKINLKDLEEEEEDEDYIPQASEIEEYKRDNRDSKEFKKKKNEEELRAITIKQWNQYKQEIRQAEANALRNTHRYTLKLMREKDLLRLVAQQALNLNKDDKQRKVIFAGQEFMVDSNGEIVGRADEQNQIKEFQLFDRGSINKIGQEEEKGALQQIELERKILEDSKEQDDIEQKAKTEEKMEEEPVKVEEPIFEEPAITLNPDEHERKELKNRFQYLQKVMDKINSKSKSITSIHKSKLDWKSFTKQEKLEKKFEQNRKAGYLDKQNFIAKATEKQKQIQKASRR